MFVFLLLILITRVFSIACCMPLKLICNFNGSYIKYENYLHLVHGNFLSVCQVFVRWETLSLLFFFFFIHSFWICGLKKLVFSFLFGKVAKKKPRRVFVILGVKLKNKCGIFWQIWSVYCERSKNCFKVFQSESKW